MSEYSRYRGRSVGRVLHALHTYCQLYGLDSTTVGDGKVNMHGKILATYTWPENLESDVPEFDFADEKWNQRQEIMKPFLDTEHEVGQSPSYIVQEVRNQLSLTEALEIRWIRDEQAGNWDLLGPTIKDRILREIRDVTWNRQTEEWYQQHWKHFALCAIMDI